MIFGYGGKTFGVVAGVPTLIGWFLRVGPPEHRSGPELERRRQVELAEKDAVMAYARAWINLDPAGFLALLKADAHYASQWVFEELESKDAIADYLIEKMKTIKDTGSKVYAELGKTRLSFPGRDCVVMAQEKKGEIQAVVIFEGSRQ